MLFVNEQLKTILYINILKMYFMNFYKTKWGKQKEDDLTVRLLIASSTCRILLNRKNKVVNDVSLYTTSGIWKIKMRKLI